MDGKVITVCTVTVAKKFVMVQGERADKKEYARGRVVWNRLSRTENGIEKTPEFREVIAFQGAARSLCHLEKGDPVQFLALQQSKSRTCEKNGVKTVYNDIVFVVYGDVTFLPRGNKTQKSECSESSQSIESKPESEPAAEQDDDLLASDATDSIVNALPF